MTKSNTNLLSRGFKAEAERKSLSFRQQLGLLNHDKLCAFELAKYLGVIVRPIFDFIPYDGRKYEDWSALLMKNYREQPLILFNSTHGVSRQQSDIMHELSHHICEHPIPTHQMLSGLPKELIVINPVYEEEAKWLGAILQISRDGLLWAKKQGMTVLDMSKYFNASQSMVVMRLNSLGLYKIVMQQNSLND